MINRRTLIASLAACALSAGLAGGASAMPDHVDGSPTSAGDVADEVRLFTARATAPTRVGPPAEAVVKGTTIPLATEVRLFRQRASLPLQETPVSREADEAIEREYRLAGEVRVPAGTSAPAWFDALMARSDALNRIHGLGAYADRAH
jgi:hypothetical protein